jgi:CheY-like chemotaxis protein
MNKYMIMHIENSHAYLDVMRRFFEKYVNIEYQPIYVETGEDAWEKLTSNSLLPDLLIIDLMLESDNNPKPGVELTRRIKGDNRFQNLKIVILTATTKKDAKENIENLGIKYYTKTFRPSKWKEEIMNILSETRGDDAHA